MQNCGTLSQNDTLIAMKVTKKMISKYKSIHFFPYFQVCQETSPESSMGPTPSSPTRMSPLPPTPLEPPELDLESQPPVIHDIVTSSPSDNEHLGATPFVTNIDLGAPLDIPAAELLTAEPEESCSTPPLTEIPVSTEQAQLDTPADIGPIPGESHVFAAAAEPEVDIPTETLTAADPPSHVEADIRFVPESTEQPSEVPESQIPESHISDSPVPETVGSVEAVEEEVEEEEAAMENEEMEPSETLAQDEREEEEEEEEGTGSIYRIIYDDVCLIKQAMKVIFNLKNHCLVGLNS